MRHVFLYYQLRKLTEVGRTAEVPASFVVHMNGVRLRWSQTPGGLVRFETAGLNHRSTLDDVLEHLSPAEVGFSTGACGWRLWARRLLTQSGLERARVRFGPNGPAPLSVVTVDGAEAAEVAGLLEARDGGRLLDWLMDRDPLVGAVVDRLSAQGDKRG